MGRLIVSCPPAVTVIVPESTLFILPSIPPVALMEYDTSVASPEPVFLIIALTPIPPETVPISIIGILASTGAKYTISSDS